MNEIIAAILGAFASKIADIAVDLYRDRQSNFPTNSSKESGTWPDGEMLTIQELRILRALSGEDEGRYIYIYRNNDYYKPSLEHLINTGLVKLSDNKYYLTSKGNRYAYSYLRWLSKSWKPKN